MQSFLFSGEGMKKLPQFVRCLISSVFSACVDFALFYAVNNLCTKSGLGIKTAIVAATVFARICSTVVNFLINKFWCFQNKERAAKQAVMFFVLFVLKMSASAALVSALSFIKIPLVVLKLIVDSILFFVSYIVQKKLIFA